MNFVFGVIVGFVVAAAMALFWLLGRQRGMRRTVPEVRKYLEEFLSGEGNPYDWDDFLSISVRDPYLDSIRNRSNRLQGDYPPIEPGHWCSPEGEKLLRSMIDELRQHEANHHPSSKSQGESGRNGD